MSTSTLTPIRPRLSVSSITFSDDRMFTFEPNDRVVIVGPNNSGKSRALRDIVGNIARAPHTPYVGVVVRDVKISRDGTLEQLGEFLSRSGTTSNDHFIYADCAIHKNILQYWQQASIGDLSKLFVKNIDAESRLSLTNLRNSIPVNSHRESAQHVLFEDDILMKKTSDLFRKAFGQDIFFDYRGGNAIPIHVGEAPTPDLGDDRVSQGYVIKVRSNPLLKDQGDGVKSYAGILFEIIAGDKDVCLIDEPEAFLHPPQMRKLGRTLADETRGQLFVATHSSDILRGFLTGSTRNVRILRLRRDGSKNSVTEADAETVSAMWDRPELRYSNALDAIFHEQAIICEDDSDCRLMNSVAEFISEKSESLAWPDTCYIPSGGKHGVNKIASALCKLGIPTKAVFDLDFLSDAGVLEVTVKAFGGSWAEIEAVWKRIDSAVRKGNPVKRPDQINQKLIETVSNQGESQISRRRLLEILDGDRPWSAVKHCGTAALPRGETQADFKLLDEMLRRIGIYVIPVGEIENFCPDVGLHGPKFVTKLLQDVPLDDNRLQSLRMFVESVHRDCVPKA